MLVKVGDKLRIKRDHLSSRLKRGDVLTVAEVLQPLYTNDMSLVSFVDEQGKRFDNWSTPDDWFERYEPISPEELSSAKDMNDANVNDAADFFKL